MNTKPIIPQGKVCLKRLFTMAIWWTIFTIAVTTSSFAQPSQWSARGIGGGGALFSPSWSPHNPNELFMACDMTELFHTTNLGQSWSAKHFRQIQTTNNRGLVQFTNTPSLLYTVDASTINGNEVYRAKKSVDGGNTWVYLNTDPTNGETYSLFADYNQPNRLVISDYDALYLSLDGGVSFSKRYSTTSDAGLHIGGSFFDGTTIYVGTNQGILRSTDNGASFSVMPLAGIPASEAIASFAGAKQGSTVRFFCVTHGAGDIYAGVVAYETQEYQGVYSIDVGQSGWTRKVSGITSEALPFFVAMSPNNINVAYVGGGSSNGTPMIFKTVNAGSVWSSILETVGNQDITTGWSGDQGDRDWSYGEFVLGLAVAANDVNRVAFTDLGFVHATTDGGKTWKQLYVDPSTQNMANAPTPSKKAYRSTGLENTTCSHLMWADTKTMVASFADIRGIRSEDAGQTWSFDYSGHTLNSMYYCLKHPVSGTLYAATSSVHDLYQSTYLSDDRIDGGSGRILFSTDKGKTWQQFTNFTANKPVVWLAADPTNPNRLYASVVNNSNGLGGIYVSQNINAGASATWTKLSKPPRTEGHPFNIFILNDGSIVCTYSGRRAPGFTASSGVFYSTDGGASWQDRSDRGMYYWTKDITIDPHDPMQNTWYVAVFSGFGGAANGKGGIYKTTNRGQEWAKISALDRVTQCSINPTVTNEAYITTETDGLWYSSNINNAAPQISRVESYSFRQPERVFFNPFQPSEVWVTSFGNGLKVGGTRTSVPQTQQASGKIYPNPVGDVLTVDLLTDMPQSGTLKLRIINMSGQVVFQTETFYNQYQKSLSIPVAHLAPGMYLVEGEIGGIPCAHSLILKGY